VWLDERELLAGDALAAEISGALNKAKVVLVVVSSASVKSRWLKFELNKATARMVRGECRVIPVVRDASHLPPEVQGLLYADFTRSFKFGLAGILSALKYEASRFSQFESFWQQTEMLIEEVFGGRGYGSANGEYWSRDFSFVTIPEPSYKEDKTTVVYEVVSDYLHRAELLSRRWWDEYADAGGELGEHFFLVISERPIGTELQTIDPQDPRIRYRQEAIEGSGIVDRTVMSVDLCGVALAERREHLAAARRLLIELARRTRSRANPGPPGGENKPARASGTPIP
jgi:hypothetical protein